MKKKKIISLLHHNGSILAYDSVEKCLIEDYKDFDTSTIYVSIDQCFDTSVLIYDVATIERIIDFRGKADVEYFYNKYFNRRVPENCGNDKILKLIIQVFKRQVKEYMKRGLDDCISFEASIQGYLARVNKGFLNIDPVAAKAKVVELNGKIDAGDKVKTNTGRLSHLKSFDKDKRRDKWVSKSIPINHIAYGTVTGRVQTKKPNLQGFDFNLASDKLISIDYTAFELMLYLHTFKPKVWHDYKNSGYKDVYGYFYCLVNKDIDSDPDSLKKDYPGKRNMMKYMLLLMINGSSRYGIEKKLKLEEYSLDQLYDKLTVLLELDLVRQKLFRYIERYGCYVCYSHQFKKTIETVDTRSYKRHKSQYDIIKNDVRSPIDAFHKESYLELHNKLFTRIVSNVIQVSGALVIKQALKMIIDEFDVDIVCLRHDEVIFKDTGNLDLDSMVEVMQDAYFYIIGEDIFLDVKKLN